MAQWWLRIGGIWLGLAIFAVNAAGQQESPTLQARLLAGASSIAPGGEVAVALELTVSKGWHVYHPILLDTGKETVIRSALSAGLRLDAWEFPEPRLKSQFDMEYLGLSGTFYVLTTARLAADGPGSGTATIDLDIKALACIEKCIPVDAKASLEIPIAAESTPQNEDVFAKARKRLPQPLARAEYLVGSRLLVKDARIPVGGASEIVAVLKVAEHHHIQDRRPSSEDFVATRILIETANGVLVKEAGQLWPPATEREVNVLGKLREQQGEVIVRAPFAINDAKFEPREVTLRVLIQYQVCSDEGQCYQPI